ncbi:MAG: DUF4157 domain-containing protein [Aestuariibacter sp.]|nr:DUF4157 domain-containing protein [Aestuariibacter sp.]
MLAAKPRENSSSSSDSVNKKGVNRQVDGQAFQAHFNPDWHNMATSVSTGVVGMPPSNGGTSGKVQARPVSSGISPVQRMCAECEEEMAEDSAGVQRKQLTVGAPNDEYEQEADSVADKVMRMPASRMDEIQQQDPADIQSKVLSSPRIQPRLQRLCAACETEADSPSIQSRSNGSKAQPAVSSSVANTVHSPGSGSPMNESVRSRVEPVLGADLSNVRVHSGEAAQQASRSLNAQAFTHRNNIFLGNGQSAADTTLMAHEATHVVQQGAGMPAPKIQRRIVMRTTTPQFSGSGGAATGTTESLRPVTTAEVESYINDIGTVHHDYDDIISGTGEEFGFVASESYRRGLIASIIRNLHRVTTDLFFDNYQEAVREVRKRALISLIMRASQGRTRGTRPTGYPRACRPAGPRVSEAAGSYWIVHPDAGDVSYWFELSSDGRSNAHEALRTLIFNHQSSACLRTLMHCDYMISAQQFFVMADTMGATDFNQAVTDGNIDLVIRWNSFENIVADTPTSDGQFQSLQSVNLSSESEFIIGDHVIFFNHDAFDDMNEVRYNARGDYSNWRLENAIITDIDSSGEFRFQGHGYFSPKRRSAFVTAMVGKMNNLVAVANSAIAAGNTGQLGFSMSNGNRFEVVRPAGSSGWTIYFHLGLGTEPSQTIAHTPLSRFHASDFPNPFVAPGETAIQVRRPIESRRQSIGGTSGSGTSGGGISGGGASPLPEPTAPVPAPTAPAPAPDIPTPAPPTGPRPLPTTPPPSGGARTEPTPQPDGGQQQQQRQEQQRPGPTPPPKPTPTPDKPCSFTCSTPKLLGARTPQYRRGNDFNHFDFPSLSTSEWLRVAPFRWMPDSMLEFGMNNVLGLLAGSDGRAMVSHFRTGRGATWTHGVGSRLNREATYCPSVNSAVASIRTQLAAQIRTMLALGSVDCSALSLSPVPVFHFGFGDSKALKGIIGGTQGFEVYLKSMRLIDPITCRYELELELVVFDDFGVDENDLYWPALIKFWILQHERSGNQPFVNRLLIKRTITA